MEPCQGKQEKRKEKRIDDCMCRKRRQKKMYRGRIDRRHAMEETIKRVWMWVPDGVMGGTKAGNRETSDTVEYTDASM